MGSNQTCANHVGTHAFYSEAGGCCQRELAGDKTSDELSQKYRILVFAVGIALENGREAIREYR